MKIMMKCNDWTQKEIQRTLNLTPKNTPTILLLVIYSTSEHKKLL